MRQQTSSELERLSAFYAKHLLRYGNGHDLLVSPGSIRRERVLRRIAAVIRLADRELSRGHRASRRDSGQSVDPE